MTNVETLVVILSRCQRPVRNWGGNTSKPQGLHGSAGSDSTMIKGRKFRNRGRIRADCAILPLGATTYSEDDDKALGESSVGTNARAWRWPFLSSWWSAALRVRGSRE